MSPFLYSSPSLVQFDSCCCSFFLLHVYRSFSFFLHLCFLLSLILLGFAVLCTCVLQMYRYFPPCCEIQEQETTRRWRVLWQSSCRTTKTWDVWGDSFFISFTFLFSLCLPLFAPSFYFLLPFFSYILPLLSSLRPFLPILSPFSSLLLLSFILCRPPVRGVSSLAVALSQ